MSKLIYAIRDVRAEMVVGGVLVFPNDASAVRTFADLVADPQTLIGRHPGDHELLVVAALDDSTAEVTAIVPPRVVVTGAALLAARDAQANG